MEWVATGLLITLFSDLTVSYFLIRIMSRKYIQTRIRAVGILLTFFILDTIVATIETITLLFNSGELNRLYVDIDQPFPILFSTMGIIGAGSFLLFIDYYESEKVPISHIVVFSSILTAFITFNWLKLFNYSLGHDYGGPQLANTPISFDFLPAIMITYILIVSYPKLFRLAKEADMERKKRSIHGLIVALAFLFIFPSIFITYGNFVDLSVDDAVLYGTLVPRIGVLIGNILLLITYATASPAFLHSQKIEKLLVISKHGTPIYTIDFIEHKGRPDDVLISGSLTALSGLLAESIEVTDLEVIQFLEKEVLIEHKSTIGYFLITDRPSQFVWNALRTSVKEISSIIGNGDTTSERITSEMIIDENLDLRVREIFGLN